MSSATPSSRPSVNRQFVLASRPTELPDESTFRMVTAPVPELKDGELLVHAMYLSVDPYMRGRISQARSYAAPVEVGNVMVGGGAARVIESKNPDFQVGEIVEIYMGWQEYAISNGKDYASSIRQSPCRCRSVFSEARVSRHISACSTFAIRGRAKRWWYRGLRAPRDRWWGRLRRSRGAVW